MEIDRETWRNSMVGDDDPLYVLERYSQTMRRLYETVLAMAPPGASGRFAQLLGEIEKMDAQCSDFLYEEAGAKLGYRGAASGFVRFDDWPAGMCLDGFDGGILVRGVPAWMLGHGAHKQFHPIYHKDSRILYKRQLWRDVFGKLKKEYLDLMEQDPSAAGLPSDPPRHAIVLFRFRSQSPAVMQDLDHFIPNLGIVVNALRDNRLIQNDRANQLSYAIQWMRDAQQTDPVADICLRWSDELITLWKNELWPVLPVRTNDSIGDESPPPVSMPVTITTVNIREHPL